MQCSRPARAVEEYPFGDGVAVFKVGGRMFALVPLEGSPASVNLTCDPAPAELCAGLGKNAERVVGSWS